MLKEFRDFLNRGNVIDLAVAVIIGAAFGWITKSQVDDLIMPIIGVSIGGIDFAGLSVSVGQAEILYGNFIQAVFNFLIIALAMFFVVRSYNALRAPEEEQPEAPPEPSPEERVLIEIRDVLKHQGR